jgi:hypothetical protein
MESKKLFDGTNRIHRITYFIGFFHHVDRVNPVKYSGLTLLPAANSQLPLCYGLILFFFVALSLCARMKYFYFLSFASMMDFFIKFKKRRIQGLNITGYLLSAPLPQDLLKQPLP